MSTYEYTDHAEAMERTIAAVKHLFEGKHVRPKYPMPDVLSGFQRRVCDILGMVAGGISHAPIPDPDRIDWNSGWGGLSVPWGNTDLATFDYGQLTLFVFLCHEARIRFAIRPNGPRGFLLQFSPRVPEGDMALRHPNLDEAVAAFRRYLPADHRIVYKPPESVTPGGAIDPIHDPADGSTEEA